MHLLISYDSVTNSFCTGCDGAGRLNIGTRLHSSFDQTLNIMNRFILFSLFLFVSCGTARNSTTVNNSVEQDSLVVAQATGKLWGKTYGDYVFHDDFYYGYSYSSDSYEHYPLRKAHNKYGIIVDFTHKEEVEGKIKALGFVINKAIVFKPNTDGQYWFYISGEGDIKQIPNVFYYTNLYQLDGGKSVFGLDNEFVVKYDGSMEKTDQIIMLAKRHNIKVGAIENRSRYGYSYIYLYCSIDSSGNAVEMANWFIECGGFPNTYPSLGDAHFDFD